MYNIKIVDLNGKPVVAKLDKEASPAEHFVGCVKLFCDLRAGAPEVLTQMRSMLGPTDNIDTQLIPFYATPLFVWWVNQHPYFSIQKINDPKDQNYACFQQINTLMKDRDIQDSSLYEEFIDALLQFKVPGIRSIAITPTSKNGSKLNRCRFPEKLIPEKFLCAISSNIMDLPAIDKRNPNVVYEKQNIVKHIKRYRKNPHTNVALQESDLEDSNLLKQLNLFMEKVQWIHDEFSKKENPIPYEKYIDDIVNDAVSVAALKAKFIKSEPKVEPVSGFNFKGIFVSYPEKTKEIIKKCNLDPNDVKAETLEKALRNLANNGLFEEIKYLLAAHQINVNAKDTGKNQKTALHWAIYQASANPKDEKYIECIKVLLANKASDEICDAQGKKPSDYIGNNESVRSLLMKPTVPAKHPS